VTPRRIGVFRGQCAESCGLQHAKMALDVHVDDPKAFEAWRRHQARAASAPTDIEAVEGKQALK
jgi:cytochrome c oxidase subunit II